MGPAVVYGALLADEPERCTLTDGNQHAVLALAGEDARELPQLLPGLPSSGALLWTNLTAQEMRKTGLAHRGGLVDAGYLPTWPRSVLGELGKLAAPAAEQAQVLAAAFGAVMRLAQETLGLDPVPAGRNLPLAIRRLYLRESEATRDRNVEFALESACREFQSNARSVLRKPTSIVLRAHRQSYASRMLSVPLPRGAWRELIAPGDADFAIEWVRNLAPERPLLLRASVTQWRGDRAAARSAVAGLGMANEVGDGRFWISAPEFLLLSTHATLQIHGVLAADGFRPNPLMSCVDNVTLGQGPVESGFAVGPFQLFGRAALSYATGLLCEAYWQALTWVPGNRKDDAAVWMLAIDRVNCLRAAMQIVDLGLGVEVTGFSRGRIWLAVDSDSLTPEDVNVLTARVVEATGMIPPALVPVAAGGSERIRLVNALTARSREQVAADGSGAAWMLAAMNLHGDPRLVAQVA